MWGVIGLLLTKLRRGARIRGRGSRWRRGVRRFWIAKFRCSGAMSGL